MATATITPDQNAVLAEIFIAAPPRASSKPLAIRRNCRSGGDKTASTMSPSPPWTSAPAASGAATAWAPTVRHFMWRASISRSILRASSSTPGSVVTQVRRRRWFAGNSSPTPSMGYIRAVQKSQAPEPWCESAMKVSPATRILPPRMATAGSACWAGWKLSWKGSNRPRSSNPTLVALNDRVGILVSFAQIPVKPLNTQHFP